MVSDWTTICSPCTTSILSLGNFAAMDGAKQDMAQQTRSVLAILLDNKGKPLDPMPRVPLMMDKLGGWPPQLQTQSSVFTYAGVNEGTGAPQYINLLTDLSTAQSLDPKDYIIPALYTKGGILLEDEAISHMAVLKATVSGTGWPAAVAYNGLQYAYDPSRSKAKGFPCYTEAFPLS